LLPEKLLFLVKKEAIMDPFFACFAVTLACQNRKEEGFERVPWR
jgi:hypothetical protein